MAKCLIESSLLLIPVLTIAEPLWFSKNKIMEQAKFNSYGLTIVILMLTIMSSFSQSVTINHVAGPIILNDNNRGVFTNIMVQGNTVWASYQIAPDTTISYGKSVWYKKFDRDMNMNQPQTIGIDVFTDTLFQNDLGDHQITMMNNQFYIVAIIKGKDKAGVMVYDTLFNKIAGPVYVGDTATDKFLDMGIGNDGNNIYTQFYHVPAGCPNPDCWGAKIYKLNGTLGLVDSNAVFPDTGSFVTGTSIVFVPNGQMGATEDMLRIFSTNKGYIDPSRIGIHTFAIRPDLTEVTGTTQTIISEDKDVYWPFGVSWNQAHQLWVVGYTKEPALNAFGTTGVNEEVGPSFIKVFDPSWNVIDSLPLNLGDSAFRVQTTTIGDDIYVTYDEMNKSGTSTPCAAKIEHFKISTSVTIIDPNSIPDAIKIFPNPSNGKFHAGNLPTDLTEIRIYNLQGQIISTLPLYMQGNADIEIEQSGIYFINFRGKKTAAVRKLIITDKAP